MCLRAKYGNINSLSDCCQFAPPEIQLWSWFYFAIGLTVFGVFGSFTYYLPELFPTRLRGTGSGFCYNAGRLITAIGPFVVGGVASRSDNPLQTALQLLFFVGFIPLIGILVMPLIIETKNRKLIQQVKQYKY